ncbi:MAG TPA: ABC transporter substrate-binding protein [Acidimicrobiales bacterium]
MRSAAVVACAALVAGLASCGGDAPAAAPTALHDDAVTVGSFDFPESELLGEIYGQALEAGGVPVHHRPRLGPRELVEPALARGLVELVPEYAGTAVDFLSLGTRRPSADSRRTRALLDEVLEGGPIVALAPSPAQDANAVVVTRAVARRHHLETISDLAPLARELTFGGPPECPARPFCLDGLERVYGLSFAAFLPLDAGGPLTHQALVDGHVDVGLLFSTDPQIGPHGLVVLDDDRGLQAAENVVPLVRREVVEAGGHELVSRVDAVSARLTTDRLRVLNGRVAAGADPADVAAGWLEAEGLT